MTRFTRIRRRPDHWPTPHARARARAAERLDGPLGLAEAAWLESHLAACPGCASVAAQYEIDRAALRSLRDAPPEPPRDLWARTAAAIERDAGPMPAPRRRLGNVPVGALSGVAVAVIVIAVGAVTTGLFDRGGQVAVLDNGNTASAGPLGSSSPPASDAPPTFDPEPTPLIANAGDVAWVVRDPDGVLAFTNAPIDRVCPADGRSGCATLDDADQERLDLTVAPKSVIGSPVDDQAVVVSDDGAGGDRLVVVSLPGTRGGEPRPTETPGSTPSAGPTEPPSATPTPTPTIVQTPTPVPTPSSDPGATASPAPTPTVTPEPTVATTLALAKDVSLVGQSAAFSPDGSWFAFTARPSDGSRGPDVYVWRVGEQEAARVTDDGVSTFASWAGTQLVVSRPTDASSMTGTAASAVTIDPASGVEIAVEGSMWRPAVDPTGTRAVAWVGTVAFDAERLTWRPADGRLELVRWSVAAIDPDASQDPGSSPDPDASPDRSPDPATSGPAQVLVEGPLADVDVRWDETGEWIAVWVADSLDSDIGRLSLYRVDPSSGRLVQPDGAPTEEPALAGFSIGEGRLAWVGPAGEDGEGSYIHVAAWVGSDVGTAESVPGQGIVVVR